MRVFFYSSLRALGLTLVLAAFSSGYAAAQEAAQPPAHAPAVAPQPAPAAPPYGQPGYGVQGPPRVSGALFNTGIAMFGGSYFLAVVMGAKLRHTGNCEECSPVGARLFVPVIGPFLAIGPAKDVPGPLSLLGSLELVGAALTIGGIVRYNNSKRRYQEAGGYTFELSRGRTLSLVAGVSPLLTGPRMNLRF